MRNTYIHFPNFNPIMFSVFFIPIHWYGFMYFLGFIFALWKGYNQAKYFCLTKIEVDQILYVCFFGLFIGGRIGYIIFYNPLFFYKHLFSIFKVWEGGMSFHGGLLGVIIVIIYFSKKLNKNCLLISDFIVPLVPFGLGLGRLGNFINGELWGKVAPNFPLSMLFPGSKKLDVILSKNNLEFQFLIDKFNVLPRHPSQLYEFFLEGVILFLILHYFSKKFKQIGLTSSVFLIVYGFFRFFVEFFRQPDQQIGYFFNILSMGQILSIPMIVFGIFILISILLKSNVTE